MHHVACIFLQVEQKVTPLDIYAIKPTTPTLLGAILTILIWIGTVIYVVVLVSFPLFPDFPMLPLGGVQCAPLPSGHMHLKRHTFDDSVFETLWSPFHQQVLQFLSTPPTTLVNTLWTIGDGPYLMNFTCLAQSGCLVSHTAW